MLVPITCPEPVFNEIVPASWNVLERRTTPITLPSYCQNTPFCSSNVPERTVAPYQLTRLNSAGSVTTAPVILPEAPNTCLDTTCTVRSSKIPDTV